VWQRLKGLFQYIIILGITALLIWFSLNSLQVAGGDSYADKWNYLMKTWHAADKMWLVAMAVVALLSHIIRAERWRMLIASTGQESRLSSTTLSVLVGYLVNLVIPRGGEISRCYNLYKLDKTPVEISFGTVVVERVVDVICLLLLVLLSFVIESKKLLAFIQQLPIGEGQSNAQVILYIAGIFAIVAGVFYWLYKKNKRFSDFTQRMWSGFKSGLLSIVSLRRKGLFISYSFLIWFLYFVMSYTVIRAFPETSDLGFAAVLNLFAIGSIAMAAPLPGGTGSYHVLVPQGLVFLYGIAQTDAVAFVFIFHGWQTAMLIVCGAVSLIITSILVKRRKD
jgi:glycosyltransferase 2 family protein